MLLINIFLPLISAVCGGLFSWFTGRSGIIYLSTSIMFFNIILTLFIFNATGFGTEIYGINIGSWIHSDSFQVDWGFYLDNLTFTLLIVVNVISGLVHLYATDYMSADPHLPRFMSYLSLFTFFMILLVTGKNLIILFLGWEGVGLCSYLLISFWYTRIAANKAALKALIVNRIADFALTIGMVAIFFNFKSLDFAIIFALAPFFSQSMMPFLGSQVEVLVFICFLLFVGAMGKSAQLGLHTWLPDAMEGPTPVSALIHAATMVTAGVFLIIKCSFLFEYVSNLLTIIAIIGALTAFFSATVALVQNDIKKVIAYSTCSQLGYMIFACGLSNYHASLFHLVNHAFFKALLFLSAGAIIHSLSNEQDMRKFGALLPRLPFTAIMLLIGSLSLMGFPFLTGFYSKDLILELALTKYTVEGTFTFVLGLITAFFTSFYSFRVFYLTFIYKNNAFRSVMRHVHELPWKMAIVLGILSLGSIFGGYLWKDLFVGLGVDFWSHSILILPEHNNQLEAEFFGLPSFKNDYILNFTYTTRWIKLLPLFFLIFAISLVYFIYLNIKFRSLNNYFKNIIVYYVRNINKDRIKALASNKSWQTSIQTSIQTSLPPAWVDEIDIPLLVSKNFLRRAPFYSKPILRDIFTNEHEINHFTLDNKQVFRRFYKFLTHKWYFDSIYNEFINRPLLKIAYNTIFRSFDKGLLEIIGPYGLSSILFNGAFHFKKMQLARVYYYAYIIALFLLWSLTVTTTPFSLYTIII